MAPSSWTQDTGSNPVGSGSWLRAVGWARVTVLPESWRALTSLTFTLTALVGASGGEAAWRAQPTSQDLMFTLWVGWVWLGGHGLIPVCPIGVVAFLWSPLPMQAGLQPP